jgi:hypothetical protein
MLYAPAVEAAEAAKSAAGRGSGWYMLAGSSCNGSGEVTVAASVGNSSFWKVAAAAAVAYSQLAVVFE